MYSFLKGKINEINNTNIVIENNGIGYEIIVPNPFYYSLNTEVIIYTYHYVREDNITLFGFSTKEEKSLFKTLLSVKGIGPKSACAMLASGTVTNITKAISASDAKFLQQFPGIGPKAAQQIVLDLQGKINFDVEEKNDHYSDVLEALVALGYKRQEATKAIKKLEQGLSEDIAIKEALKNLIS